MYMTSVSLFNVYNGGVFSTPADEIRSKSDQLRFSLIEEDYTNATVIDNPFQWFSDLKGIQNYADKIIHKVTFEKQPKMFGRIISDARLATDLGEVSCYLSNIARCVDVCIYSIERSFKDKSLDQQKSYHKKIQSAV